MAHVFISYSRKDKDELDQLARIIEQAGYTTWVDRRGLSGGDQWDEKVAHAIAECDAFILALSPSSVESKSVRAELNFAIEENRKVIPVILKSVEIPRAIRFRLDTRNRIEALTAEGIEKVVEALGGRKYALGELPSAEKKVESKNTKAEKTTSKVQGLKAVSYGVIAATLLIPIIWQLSKLVFEQSIFDLQRAVTEQQTLVDSLQRAGVNNDSFHGIYSGTISRQVSGDPLRPVDVRFDISVANSVISGRYTNSEGDSGLVSGTVDGLYLEVGLISAKWPGECEMSGSFNANRTELNAQYRCPDGEATIMKLVYEP